MFGAYVNSGGNGGLHVALGGFCLITLQILEMHEYNYLNDGTELNDASFGIKSLNLGSAYKQTRELKLRKLLMGSS